MTLKINDKIEYFVKGHRWVKGCIADVIGFDAYIIRLEGCAEDINISQTTISLRRLILTWQDKPKFYKERNTFLVGESGDFPKINQALKECYRQLSPPLSFRRSWITLNITNAPAIFEATQIGLSRTIPTFARVIRSRKRDIHLRQDWSKILSP